jgi:hypothetical protein
MKKTLLLVSLVMGLTFSLYALKSHFYTLEGKTGNTNSSAKHTNGKPRISNASAGYSLVDTVVHLSTIAQMIGYTDSATSVILSDTLQGGSTPFIYQPAYTGAIDSGIYFPATGKGHGAWQRLTTGSKYSVTWWGAKGDSVNVDTHYIQNAITYLNRTGNRVGTQILYFPKGKYVVDHTLFLYSNISWEGDGVGTSKIYPRGNYGNSVDTLYTIALGIVSKGGTVIPWRGSHITGIQFHPNAGTKVGTLINGFSIDDSYISNNYLYLADLVPANGLCTAIETALNTSWCAGSSITDFTITNNKVTAKHAYNQGEGIGVTKGTRIIIDNNYISGIGDDGIAFHNCTNVSARNNKIYVIDGRIFLSNTKDAKIDGNYIERIADQQSGKWISGGDFIRVTLEAIGTAQGSENIDITNNTVYLPSNVIDTTFQTYQIRVQGVQAGHVTGNTCISNSARIQSAISIESVTLAGWTGVLGNPDFSNGGTQRPRNIIVNGNVCKGNNPGNIVENALSTANIVGPILYTNNIGKYSLIGAQSFVGGQLFGSGTPQSVIAAPPGSMYTDISNTTNNLWVKLSGTTNTGWAQFSPSIPSGIYAFSGNASTTSFSVTYTALGYVPSNVILMPSSTAASSDWSIVSLGSTGFTINYKSPPATGTNNITGKYSIIR